MNLLYANDRPGQYPQSWYAETATPLPPFDPLRGETRADVCVIGGGYTGLSAALALAEAGVDVVLVEAHRAGFGASGRNGGQVGSGQRLGQDALEKMVGQDAARALWQIGEDAKAELQRLITSHGIDCAFRPGVAHVLRKPADVDGMLAYAEHLSTIYGYDRIELLGRDSAREAVGSDVFAGGLIDWGAGHVHPLRLALGMARGAQAAGARIHEMTQVHRIEPGTTPLVATDRGRVRAGHVIVAANGYIGGLQPDVAARVMPINNFIIATEPLGARADDILARDIAVADDKFVVNYWRKSEDGRLLFGGGESYGYRFPRDIAALVRKPMLSIYPQLRDVEITHAWGGTLAITMNRLPNFSRPAPGVWSASGYSGHGVALATLAGRILADALNGDTTRFDTMAALPSPRFPGGVGFRSPLLALAMTWYAMRDRLGV
ncbi:MAG: FAD-binding oxidoreductase [Rhodobacteraceae bacterium]|nr:FAD-binding oxidoreductase [Paracoccaceae bacterium]